MRLLSSALAAGLAAAILATAASAHEFWLSPRAYEVGVGRALEADIRTGESFKGNASPYFTRNVERFEVLMGGRRIDPEATLGDRPVLDRSVPGEGLAVVIYETRDSRLTYQDWQKFVNFVEHKAFDGALARHDARGLPREGFVETYRRYAKSLIAVGGGAGSDRPVGLDTEIVALANPYTDAVDAMPVQVLLYGQPRANAQVETYIRAPSGEVSVDIRRTDANGRAAIPIRPGHEYMVDAVVLEERSGDVAWHSMWANLTFSVPAR
ncbi:MAG: DUF4198 domain-containing protein [Pseudomonadota bacterium]